MNDTQRTPTYPFSEEMVQRLDNDFSYHPTKGDQVERYQIIRDEAKRLAYLIAGHTPKSREQSVALTLLEQVVMMANAAIARNE